MKMIGIMMTACKSSVAVVGFDVIKTESSAKKSRICVKRKVKGKSFCWVANYINMTNDFFNAVRIAKKT